MAWLIHRSLSGPPSWISALQYTTPVADSPSSASTMWWVPMFRKVTPTVRSASVISW